MRGRRTYVKKGVWHLDKKNKQTGDFLPLLASLAKPIFMSVAESIGSWLLQGVGKKIFGGRTCRYGEDVEG